MANPEFDFKEPIEKTSTVLAKVVLDKLVEGFDIFIYEDIEMSDEKKKELVEKGTDFSINLMSLMTETDIPADYATYSIDKVIAALKSMKDYIDGTVRQMNDEILSRRLGAKSPRTDTFARDCATLADVFIAVDKSRKESDGEYFIHTTPQV